MMPRVPESNFIHFFMSVHSSYENGEYVSTEMILIRPPIMPNGIDAEVFILFRPLRGPSVDSKDLRAHRIFCVSEEGPVHRQVGGVLR